MVQLGANMPLTDPDAAILVVEDEFLIRTMISDYLQDCGYKVYQAASAAEAIQVIQSDGVSIDCVFTDIRMPGEMDGFGLCNWIRKNYPGLLVILTSGDAQKMKSARDLCEQAPFFAKPYDLHHVVGQIRSLLHARSNPA
jgi:CheY-like chemotaxis protein